MIDDDLITAKGSASLAIVRTPNIKKSTACKHRAFHQAD
jgi:hypothetical protein